MKQPADSKTIDAFPKDVFDLTHADDWPFPEALPEWQPKQIPQAEPTLREWLSGLLKK